MKVAELPFNEARRLQCLAELGLSQPPAEPEPDAVLDGLVRCAAHLLGYPIALVSLVGEHRMWFKARHGIDAEQGERDQSFCAHTILGDGLFEVPDARADTRFADSHWVTSDTGLRAYAGLPIRLGDLTLGALCIVDTQPRQLSAVQAALLADIANAVTAWFAHRREHVDLLASRAHLQTQAELLGRLSSEMPGMLFQYRSRPDGTGELGFVSGQAERIFGPLPLLQPESLRAFAERAHPEDLPGLLKGMREAEASRQPWQRLFRVCLPGAARPAWRSGRASPSVQPDGSVLWHGFVADVDEHLEIATLRRDKLAAEQASAAKSAFLSRASHELRTPLNAVLGFSQLLLLSSDEPLTPRQQQRVEWVLNSAQRLHELVDGLLDVERGTASGSSTAAGSAAGAHTLLYIEDEPLNTLLVQEALRTHPEWRVLHAANGSAGLALARAERPDAVLTDINLPGMSGLDVVKELRADAALAGTLCIALSADATPGQTERALQAGCDAYWTKPLDVLELAGRLADALARHGGR